MGLFDFLNARKSTAKWAAKLFKQASLTNPQLSELEIVELALRSRYGMNAAIGLKPREAEVLRARRHEATEIFSLCHLIAEVELLSDFTTRDRLTLKVFGENAVFRTYRQIDEELIRLGFQPGRS